MSLRGIGPTRRLLALEIVKTKEVICIAIIVFVGIFYLLTIRKGTPWADDFAMYIHETKNLAEGIPLGQTGYIYNPQRPSLGPRLYPPVFSVLLIPGYLIGGLNNLTPMKVEIVFFFIAILVALWKGLGSNLPLSYRAAMLAIVGLNPLFWAFKDLIVSDIPFTFLLYITLDLADRLSGNSRGKQQSLLQVVLLGGLVYLCFGTRTIGIVLVPAVFLVAAINWKRESRSRSLAWAGCLGLILSLIQQWFLGAETSYRAQLSFSLQKLFDNVFFYAWSLAIYWENPYSKALRDFIFVTLTLLALVAYIRRIRKTPSIYEVFLPLYMGVAILFPDPAERYLAPVLPLYVFYFLKGAQEVSGWLRMRRPGYILTLLLGLILVSYGTEFTRFDFGPSKEGFENKETVEMLSFIRSRTNVSDVIIFRRPRGLALFTGRSASIYPESHEAAEFCRYFQSIHATYLVEAPAIDDQSYREFVEREVSASQLAFSNSDFRVFSIDPDQLTGCIHAGTLTHSPPALSRCI